AERYMGDLRRMKDATEHGLVAPQIGKCVAQPRLVGQLHGRIRLSGKGAWPILVAHPPQERETGRLSRDAARNAILSLSAGIASGARSWISPSSRQAPRWGRGSPESISASRCGRTR